MAQLERFQMLIGGKAVDAASGKTFESQNPYTGEPWALIPDGGPEDVEVRHISHPAPRGPVHDLPEFLGVHGR